MRENAGPVVLFQAPWRNRSVHSGFTAPIAAVATVNRVEGRGAWSGYGEKSVGYLAVAELGLQGWYPRPTLNVLVWRCPKTQLL
jgi:hypothetical protein